MNLACNDDGDLSALRFGGRIFKKSILNRSAGNSAGIVSGGDFMDRLPVVEEAAVDSINSLVSRNQSWCFEIESQHYEFTFTWQPHTALYELKIIGRALNTPFVIGLEWWVFNHVICLDKLTELPASVQPLYLEVLAEDLCTMLEQLTALPVQFDGFAKDQIEERHLQQRLDFYITRRGDGKRSAGYLLTTLDGLRSLADRMRQYAPIVSPVLDGIGLPLRLEIGRRRMALRSIEQIERQDVIILGDRHAIASGGLHCRLQVAPGYYLDCVWDGHDAIAIGNTKEVFMPEQEDGRELREEDMDENTSENGRIAMPEEQVELYPDDLIDRQDEPADIIDRLPVEIVFELGACTVSVKELKSFQQGTILKTQRPENEPVSIKANGKKIGSGELVRLQSQIGIRVLELYYDV